MLHHILEAFKIASNGFEGYFKGLQVCSPQPNKRHESTLGWKESKRGVNNAFLPFPTQGFLCLLWAGRSTYLSGSTLYLGENIALEELECLGNLWLIKRKGKSHRVSQGLPDFKSLVNLSRDMTHNPLLS